MSILCVILVLILNKFLVIFAGGGLSISPIDIKNWLVYDDDDVGLDEWDEEGDDSVNSFKSFLVTNV